MQLLQKLEVPSSGPALIFFVFFGGVFMQIFHEGSDGEEESLLWV